MRTNETLITTGFNIIILLVTIIMDLLVNNTGVLRFLFLALHMYLLGKNCRIPRRPANLHLQTPLNTPYLSTEDSVRNSRRMLNNMETCEPTERREDCLGLEQGGKGKWVCAGFGHMWELQ